jgi:uncharacterized protein YchJ
MTIKSFFLSGYVFFAVQNCPYISDATSPAKHAERQRIVLQGIFASYGTVSVMLHIIGYNPLKWSQGSFLPG